MKYTLGIDIGIASIGWCLLDEDKKRIDDLGVRIFVAAEQPKSGAPLAEPRRLARSARRRIRRRRHRIERLQSLLIRIGLVSKEEVDSFGTSNHLNDPYAIRIRALEKKLENQEWARVLLHIAKRRGFKSNRKSDAKTKDGGQMMGAIKDNQDIMKENTYQTVGEMLVNHSKFCNHKRNKGGSYLNTISRDMLEEELHTLFAAQRQFGNGFADEDVESNFCSIFLSQRPFAPKEAIEKLVGKCTFEKEEKRAPKHSFTAERFVLLQKATNLKLVSSAGKSGLTLEQQKEIEKLAYSLKEVTYKQVRKALKITPEWQFAGLSYYRRGGSVDPEKAVFIALHGYHSLKEAITTVDKAIWLEVEKDRDMQDTLAWVLTVCKTDEDIQNTLEEAGVNKKIIQAVEDISYDKFQHLSLKAMRKILPFLEEGFTYGDACTKAGYCHWDPTQNIAKRKYLTRFTQEEMRNPVVRRALTQARQVINAIIRKYGSPYRIHVEVAREIAKPHSERDAIQREQKNYQDRKEQIKNEFNEHFRRKPSSEELLKYRLYREQDSRCAYTQEYLDPNRVMEPGYAEIDHILPYSRSYDDSMANKVLVKTLANRNKGNRTPYEYMGQDEQCWHKFEEWVKVNIKNNAKRNRLLREKFGEQEEAEMKSRNLNDTRYISRYLSQLLKQQLIFANQQDKNPVLMINGQITAFLRARWGLIKIRENGDLHHALDASVVAAASQAMVNRISSYSKAKELYYSLQNGQYIDKGTGEIKVGPYRDTIDKNLFPQLRPGEQFRDELIARLSQNPQEFIAKFRSDEYTQQELDRIKPIFVSRAPTRKETGSAHKETIRSKKYLSEQVKVQKISINKLTWDKNKDDFKDDIHGKERDWRLYEALKEKVRLFGGNVEKAFVEPFYKPIVGSSKKAPQVKSVKVRIAGDSGVEINGGIADNGDMVKVIVYTKGKKYFLVPVYVHHLVKPELPCKAIKVGQIEDNWPIMDSSYKYCFTLYPNDLVYVKRKEEEILGYYKACNRKNGQVSIETHDRSKPDPNIEYKGWQVSFGTFTHFEKLHVDPLGNYYRPK